MVGPYTEGQSEKDRRAGADSHGAGTETSYRDRGSSTTRRALRKTRPSSFAQQGKQAVLVSQRKKNVLFSQGGRVLPGYRCKCFEGAIHPSAALGGLGLSDNGRAMPTLENALLELHQAGNAVEISWLWDGGVFTPEMRRIEE
jgi:hypothetical protein